MGNIMTPPCTYRVEFNSTVYDSTYIPSKQVLNFYHVTLRIFLQVRDNIKRELAKHSGRVGLGEVSANYYT